MARSTDRRRRRVGVLVAGVAAVSAGIAGLQLTPAAAPVARADGLVPYDGCPELLDAYRSTLRDQAAAWAGGYLGRDAVASTDAGAARSESSGAADSAVGSGPTGTNLQEQGVDEPDVAKLRDGRVVTLTGNVLRVVSASRQPSVTGSLRVGRADAYGGELLLLDDDRALVVLPGWRQDGPPPADVTGRLSVMPVGVPLTTLVLVSIGDGDPAVVEESTLTGQYVSARLTDGTVRLVTTSRPALPVAYPMRPGPAAEQLAMTANQAVLASLGVDDVLPQVERRDADGRVIASGPAVGCSSVVHPSQASAASTLVVTTLRPSEGLAATDATAVTTDGDLVYAAEDRLYVATSRWGTVAPLAVDDVAGSGVTGSRDAVEAPDEVTTQMHAFDTTSATRTTYVGSGRVPGYVMGRWALSRHDGDLRVATTRQPPWTGEGPSATSSMVVRLAEEGDRLVETGRVEGLGPTEHIRAVRYFGNLAVVVTFRQTDPLYLVSLAGTPRVLGELKVPGFSTYLHPVGDGLLLGLGQQATEDGRITGMQLSLFDVSDASAPTLVDRLPLGEGWSPAGDDSRAFSYDPAHAQAMFPLSRWDSATGVESNAVVGVRVDASARRLVEVGSLAAPRESWSSRALVSGDTVLTVGEGGVVAGDVATMTETGSVEFPLPWIR